MATAVAVWSLQLEPGQTESFVPLGDLRITNVALGAELADENGRTSVKLVYIGPSADDSDEDDEEEDEEDEDEDKPGSGEPVSTVLCSLTPGKIEQCTVDIVLEGDQEFLFESVGKNVVYLTGNYIDQPNRDQTPFDDDSDSDEDEFDLRDVSSDVEIDPDEMEILSDDDAQRFEEVDEEEDAPVAEASKASKKRPRESDTADEAEPKLSKKEKKKAKKLKAENGEAVPTGEANGVEEKKEKKKDKKEKKEAAEEKKTKLSEPRVLDGGVKVADNKLGNGPAAKNGDRVSVRYVGKLQNGKVFDSNTKGKPFQFRLGKGEVIQGWDLGVAGMKAGGERLITVPPAKGYGNKKQGGIPANSTLIFEVKVIQIN
ncbi:peptidylprolyl isomerase fpr4 [Steccherinum ochraceum]|uniref:FK506-binding protein n=1 Tax=Steccherinum ochraceum TaxID=92696 RepID=A0A4V2MWY7_9APHY|nr:peptidylprolyl isomerase fpr4 [Steccherinum ochraceum]